jgi:4-hydroxybenzoate polyprenyltransferase
LNGSSRPLATGLVDLGTARIVAASCATCGVAIGLATCAGLGALSIALLVLGVGYSYGPCWKSGRRSAGVVIGAGAALTYCAGAVVGDVATWQLVAFTTALSVWVAMASASKDFSDIIGDRRSGRRTAPVELGSDEASRRLTSTTSLASVLVAGVTVTLGVRPIAAGCIVLGTVVLGLVLGSTRDPTSRVSTRAAYRVYMVTQYAACGGLLLGVAI